MTSPEPRESPERLGSPDSPGEIGEQVEIIIIIIIITIVIIIIIHTSVLGSEVMEILGPVNGSSKSVEGRREGNIACWLYI